MHRTRLSPRSAPATLLLVAAAPLLACGSPALSSTGCLAAPSSPSRATAASVGAVAVAIDEPRVVRGSSLGVVVTAHGPARIAAPCSGPVSLVVVDSAGLHVFADAPAAATGDPCGDVTLASGQAATWRLTWAVDSTLPAGSYIVDVTAGDAPDVSLPVTVDAAAAESTGC